MSPRLFFHVWSLEARSSMSYRVDFWLNTIADFSVRFGIVYFLWQAMFQESGSDRIAGYSFDAMLIYYLAVILLGKLVRGRNFDLAVASDIYEGGLNRYLVFPAPYFPFKYAQHLGSLLSGFVQLAMFGAIGLMLLHVPPEFALTPAGIGMALTAVMIGNLLHFTLSFPIHAVAFWQDNVWSLEVAKRFAATLLGGFMLPLDVFPKPMQDVLAWLPFQFFFSFPARALLGQLSFATWARGLLLAVVWCGLLGLVCRAVWRRGRLRYTGVGI